MHSTQQPLQDATHHSREGILELEDLKATKPEYVFCCREDSQKIAKLQNLNHECVVGVMNDAVEL
eukprot:5946545-Amphidinium_carterae.1